MPQQVYVQAAILPPLDGHTALQYPAEMGLPVQLIVELAHLHPLHVPPPNTFFC
jgi:hypothetical protein